MLVTGDKVSGNIGAREFGTPKFGAGLSKRRDSAANFIAGSRQSVQRLSLPPRCHPQPLQTIGHLAAKKDLVDPATSCIEVDGSCCGPFGAKESWVLQKHPSKIAMATNMYKPKIIEAMFGKTPILNNCVEMS